MGYYSPRKNPLRWTRVALLKQVTLHSPKNELPLGHYSPILGQVAERYHPKGVPVTGQHHPIYGQVVYPHGPISVQALVSTINNTKQVNNINNKGLAGVFIFFHKKVLMLMKRKKMKHNKIRKNALEKRSGNGEPIQKTG